MKCKTAVGRLRLRPINATVPSGLSVIDVGAGRSRLADALIAYGCRDVTILDLSNTALSAAAVRTDAPSVDQICEDVTQWTPQRTWSVWHDRAVFHFLTDSAERVAYKTALLASTLPGSRIVIATFAEDGPIRCRGLPVCRYGPQKMVAEFGSEFTLLDAKRFGHQTPSGITQRFRYFSLVRT